MRVPPTSPTNLAERHVQLSEFVDVSVHSMTDTQMSTIIGPSVHAQRLERMMRTAEIPAAPVVSVPHPVEDVPCCTRVYKRAFNSAFLCCGLLSIPALALAAVSPVLLAVPAGLLVASGVCYCLRGKPTLAMEQEYEMRRVAARLHDSQGV